MAYPPVPGPAAEFPVVRRRSPLALPAAALGSFRHDVGACVPANDAGKSDFVKMAEDFAAVHSESYTSFG